MTPAPDAAEVLKSEIDMLLDERKVLRAELAKLRKRTYKPNAKLALAVAENIVPRIERPRCGLCGGRPCQCGLEAYP